MKYQRSEADVMRRGQERLPDYPTSRKVGELDEAKRERPTPEAMLGRRR